MVIKYDGAESILELFTDGKSLDHRNYRHFPLQLLTWQIKRNPGMIGVLL